MNPRDLPVYNHEAELLAAAEAHRVIVVEGPTGSGKTTQVPRILASAGLTDRIIGVTQPRRIAAVSVAWRIAEEEQVEIGTEVGYAIRFDDKTGPETRLKVMTDGILLQEARTDPLFSRYGVIMVDEAHERSLNIDFTLGLLHRALTKRDDLQLIISSATLQPEVFQRYFESVAGEVPVVSIDARPFPVEMVYRPTRDDFDSVVGAATEEILRIHRDGEPGHVLCFLSGEAMIKAVRHNLLLSSGKAGLWVLPLYGKLTREQQERVFKESPDRRKVVLSTNIAETSITIPDVRFVVDSGLAKVPRVQRRTGIQVLREEGVSRASADQRAGRAGRTAPGVCVRLYSRKDYARRDAFTDEEILRLDLTDVVLRLIDLGVQDVESFPFPTPPDVRDLRTGVAALQAMGAIDRDRRLTAIGRRMAPFPLGSSLARMVVEASDRFVDVVDEVLMVGAFLSSRSPFLYPQGEEAEARAAQRGLAHPMGDALTAVGTLRRYQKASNKARFCKDHYLDPTIMGFITKVHGQLTDIAEHGGIAVRGGGDQSLVIRCVAAGFAHRIMRSKGRIFEEPSGTKVAIHPSSALFGSRPQFVVAAELMVSTRAYARSVSVLQPEWIADVNPELAKHWHIASKRRKRAEKKRPEPSTVPDVVQIGGVELEVHAKRGRPTILVPVEKAEALSNVSLEMVPARMMKWKAKLQSGSVSWGRGMALRRLICVLPHMPLPEGAPQLIRDVPLGALLEVDRNLHTLARFAARVLEPGMPQRGKRPGWLTLISNGDEGFWFEVVGDYAEALDSSVIGVRALSDALPAGDALREELDPLLERLETRDVEMSWALKAARNDRDRSRGH